jgi:protein involved in polysaccharide export with SLBB domain
MSNINLRKWLRLCFSGLTVAALIVGCATTPVYQEPDLGEVAKDETRADKLRVGDTIRVDFSNLSERQMPPHEEQIKGDGTITLPLIGAVQALGKSTGELQNEIQKAYSKYFVSMNVTVKAPERYYSVGGEVRTPKRDVYVGGTTVIKAIQSAGDFTEFARRNKVILTRANGKSFTVDCDKALRDPRLDLPVYPGDTIHVPRRYF